MCLRLTAIVPLVSVVASVPAVLATLRGWLCRVVCAPPTAVSHTLWPFRAWRRGTLTTFWCRPAIAVKNARDRVSPALLSVVSLRCGYECILCGAGFALAFPWGLCPSRVPRCWASWTRLCRLEGQLAAVVLNLGYHGRFMAWVFMGVGPSLLAHSRSNDVVPFDPCASVHARL